MLIETELHGKKIKDYVSEVSWEGGELADEFMDEFAISLTLPKSATEYLIFPVFQKCKNGSRDWDEIVTASGAQSH